MSCRHPQYARASYWRTPTPGEARQQRFVVITVRGRLINARVFWFCALCGKDRLPRPKRR